jgi:Secretion system C-terminal sorting domain
MKTTIKIFSFLALSTFSGAVVAQRSISQDIQNEDGKIKIHIESEENGKKNVFDRSYDTKGMSEQDRQALIDRITDSVSTGDNGRKRIKIKINRNDNRIDSDNDNMDIQVFKSKKKPNAKVKKYFKDKNGVWKDEEVEVETDADVHVFSFDDRELEKMGKDISKEFKNFGDNLPSQDELMSSLRPMMKQLKGTFSFNDSDFMPFNESKTVKSLKAYPNKPSNSKLNVRFYSPEKGDITISITDVKGKEVGSEKVKDFQGEYMGQINLKSDVKGTLFVTVIQGEDGAVRRIVVE